MDSNYLILVALIPIWVHWIADFVLQSDSMAKNKSTSNKWLLCHVSTYTAVLSMCFGWQYGLLNGVTHLIVDFFTSRATSALWKKGEVHWFFVVIGFDQAIHITILLLSLPLLHIPGI